MTEDPQILNGLFNMKFSKSIIWHSKEYLKWLKKQPCSLILPGCLHEPTYPHHTKTRGSGGGDDFCLSACRLCHSGAHVGSISKEEQFRIAILQRSEWLKEIGI